ncbi:MAG: MTH1187 family thiamine-binding protein [Abditibacteriota bacterium]|nr:MTH1187 family thiamine-binding protein [Abditibacteriota bacterium]
MLVSLTVIPLGESEELKEKIAEIVKIIADSGLKYKLGSMQTTIEGDGWDRVMGVVRACHEKAMELAPRCLTSITIDDRRGFTGRLEGKVKDVQDILAEREVRVE